MQEAQQKIRTLEELSDAMERYLDELYERAVSVADKFWDFVYQQDQRLDWEKRSRLFLRVRKTGNSIRIEWYEVKWVGSRAKNNRRSLRVYIAKPRGQFRYSATKLTALARDWEADMVLKTEDTMAEFRREARAVTLAILAIRPLVR